MPRWRLDSGVSLTVLASAATARDHEEDFGCGLQGPASRRVRLAAKPLVARIRRLGKEKSLATAESLVRWLEATPRYSALCETRGRRAGRRTLRSDVLFPDVSGIKPRVLHLRGGAAGLDVPIPERDWPATAELFQALAAGATARELDVFARASAAHADMLGVLSDAGWIVPARAPIELPAGDGRALFVGHNMVLVAGAKARVLVDPWFRPRGDTDLPRYAPLQPADIGPVDAIAITHSHGDHFHVGSLLPFGRTTPILVPAVARESLLTTDLAKRLATVGFTNVIPLPWWKEHRVGDVTVQAMPFYGEQPTDGPPVYDAVWNEGNTYVVRTPSLSCAFLADSGHDVRGRMIDVARRARKKAPLDVLFTGIRGFRMHPLFFGFTTIDAFLVNVPLGDLARPQQLMNDASDALDIGAAFGARWVVPYADGGAPWYWREGMGPSYVGFPAVPGWKPAPATPADDPDSAPFPERLEEERVRRDAGPEALILRPGDAFRLRRGALERHRYDEFAWPFDEAIGRQA